jgi:hypothetical protein
MLYAVNRDDSVKRLNVRKREGYCRKRITVTSLDAIIRRSHHSCSSHCRKQSDMIFNVMSLGL